MAKRTPLYAAHASLGARFVEFGGWEMPVQYSGIIDEHTAVRTRAGLFDVSHMGEVEVSGNAAFETCQRLTVNDVARLSDGHAQYSLLCLPSGGVVDDVMVHRLAADRYFFCVNASNADGDFAWMHEHRGHATVTNRSDDFGLLALQGPRATAILMRLTAVPLDRIAPFGFAHGEVAGKQTMVAHTGYTGEDGWEIYCAPDVVRAVWDALLDTGRPDGLLPCGLGARDTLRLERCLPLYGHELTTETTPLEAGLAWVVRLNKGDFIGGDALREQKRRGLTRKLVGFELTEPGIARQGYPILHDGKVIGGVTSGTKSPTLGKAIGLGYVAAAYAEVGTNLAIEIRGRAVAAVTVPLPFYRRS
ncbi:MAG TPA: glycine cleavage system aminomethyltransferase GcvT [Candidatus Kryptonia bacterium]|nr:glycine cleavage system aminomethyltransferase GcvT [Candidatus Kryptonia bacterium]